MAIKRGTTSVGSAFDPKAYHGGPAKKLSLDDWTKMMTSMGPGGPPPGVDPRGFTVDEGTLPPIGKSYRGPVDDIDYGPKEPEPMPTFETPPSYEIPEMPKVGSGKMYSRGEELAPPEEEGEESEYGRLTRLRREADPMWDRSKKFPGASRYIIKPWVDPAKTYGIYPWADDPKTIGTDWEAPTGPSIKSRDGGFVEHMDHPLYGKPDPRYAGTTHADKIKRHGYTSPETLKYRGGEGTFRHMMSGYFPKRDSHAGRLADEGRWTDEMADAYVKGIGGISPEGRHWYGTPEGYARGDPWVDPSDSFEDYIGDDRRERKAEIAWDPETKTFSSLRDFTPEHRAEVAARRAGWGDLETGHFIGKTPVYDTDHYGFKTGGKSKFMLDGTELTGWSSPSMAYGFIPDDYTISETGGITTGPSHLPRGWEPTKYVSGYDYPTAGVTLEGGAGRVSDHEAKLRAFYGDEVYEGLRTPYAGDTTALYDADRFPGDRKVVYKPGVHGVSSGSYVPKPAHPLAGTAYDSSRGTRWLTPDEEFAKAKEMGWI